MRHHDGVEAGAPSVLGVAEEVITRPSTRKGAIPTGRARPDHEFARHHASVSWNFALRCASIIAPAAVLRGKLDSDVPVGLRSVSRAALRPRVPRAKRVLSLASTGIGAATAAHLASIGFRVLAGVRSAADFERLRVEGGGIQPVMFDVTNAEHVSALVELVDRQGDGRLAALVNNVGIGAPGPIEAVPPDEWRAVLETNVIGVVAVTQALLPALLRSGGRVVNMGSGGGRVAFPLFGPYNTSKFALEGFTDVLRREVSPHGVRVSLIQPGIVATPIYAKHLPISYERIETMAPAVWCARLLPDRVIDRILARTTSA